MAARRLVAVMLVLLFLSSLAAALAPVENRSADEDPPATPAPTKTASDDGELVQATVVAGALRPRPVTAHVGDQLRLRVIGSRPATVEIAAFGVTEDLDPLAPARFDLFLDRPGKFLVRVLGTGRELGRIVVRPSPGARKERAGAPARSRS
jgi:hypothetical protein